VLFVVEEASVYLKPQLLPDPFKRLVRMGRHRPISQIYVAQRPAMLHRDILSQSDWVATFQQHGSTDVKYLEDVFAERAELIRTLTPSAPGRAGELMLGGPSPQLAPKAVKARIRSKPWAGAAGKGHE
jgi:DNA helicase HerA-like ATPase